MGVAEKHKTDHGIRTVARRKRHNVGEDTAQARDSHQEPIADPVRDSVMRIQGTLWVLGDGKVLGNGLLLNDSVVGKGEGTYKDGNPDGVYIGWAENGQKLPEELYRNGVLINNSP